MLHHCAKKGAIRISHHTATAAAVPLYLIWFHCINLATLMHLVVTSSYPARVCHCVVKVTVTVTRNVCIRDRS